MEFVLDDIEDTWIYRKKFNFIHARMMVGSLEDWPRFLRRCFEYMMCTPLDYSLLMLFIRNVMPGGFVEVMAPDWPFRSDDDSLPAESALNKWSSLMQRASIRLKRPIDVAPQISQLMYHAGFVNIFEHVYKWPINAWPKNEEFKEIGRYVNQDLSEGLEGFSLKFLTGGLEWDKQEVEVLCAKVRNELRDRRLHAYLNM